MHCLPDQHVEGQCADLFDLLALSNLWCFALIRRRPAHLPAQVGFHQTFSIQSFNFLCFFFASTACPANMQSPVGSAAITGCIANAGFTGACLPSFLVPLSNSAGRFACRTEWCCSMCLWNVQVSGWLRCLHNVRHAHRSRNLAPFRCR
jgi:hypothetical protein